MRIERTSQISINENYVKHEITDEVGGKMTVLETLFTEGIAAMAGYDINVGRDLLPENG